MKLFSKKTDGITYFVDSRKRVERAMILGVADVVTIIVCTFMALWVRFDFKFSTITPEFLNAAIKLLPINIVTTIVIYMIFQLYKSVWRYASADEMLKIVGAILVEGITLFVVTLIAKIHVPRSYYLFYTLFLGICAVGIRFSYRFLRVLRTKGFFGGTPHDRKNVMIVGAGEAGNTILKEIEASSYISMDVRCFIDDNPGCHGKVMRGVPIVGGRDKIQEAVKTFEIDEIIIAIPSASRNEVKKIIEICKETGCKLQIVPGMYQLINGDVSVSKLREVEIEDLLGRDPVATNVDEIAGYVKGKTVMVTGGGGSIGSELCRQIARHEPKCLLIVDIYENNAYDIQQELRRTNPELNLVVLIASVRNTERINQIFEEYKPEIVYHAAAHKHVPLMEDSPGEAIKNNVFGTYKVTKAADRYGVEKFVLISTDKAVNPTNIMGASKRMCEMIIQMMNERSKTEFVAVRFGNVLGSNGSVIPLFKKQIAAGGPVTVTDPNIIRYFMTISEAVSLILQAGAYAQGGEIFVLDMGEPVKILDLAQNLIKLSGYRVGEDIEIVFTGLRPGEKMYEEMLMDEEGLKGTENAMIHIGKPLVFDYDKFENSLTELKEIAENHPEEVKNKVSQMLETYHPKD